MTEADPAYRAIKKRHPDIPQDPLPFVFDLAPDRSTSNNEPTRRRRGPASIRKALCPKCRKDEPTGVIRAPDGSEVFRDHNKVMRNGLRIPCAGSGTVAPDGP
jgi:hypothetical protein